jgi:hypothetical protein
MGGGEPGEGAEEEGERGESEDEESEEPASSEEEEGSEGAFDPEYVLLDPISLKETPIRKDKSELPLTKGKDGVQGHDITDKDGPGSFWKELRKIFYEQTAGVDYKRPCKVGALGRVLDYWHVMQSPLQFVILAKTPKAARGKQTVPGSDGGAEGKKGSPVERREDTEGGGRGYNTTRRGKGKAPDLEGVAEEREESAGNGQRNKTSGGRKRKAADVEGGPTLSSCLGIRAPRGWRQ